MKFEVFNDKTQRVFITYDQSCIPQKEENPVSHKKRK